jgi:hypothetical protein
MSADGWGRDRRVVITILYRRYSLKDGAHSIIIMECSSVMHSIRRCDTRDTICAALPRMASSGWERWPLHGGTGVQWQHDGNCAARAPRAGHRCGAAAVQPSPSACSGPASHSSSPVEARVVVVQLLPATAHHNAARQVHIQSSRLGCSAAEWQRRKPAADCGLGHVAMEVKLPASTAPSRHGLMGWLTSEDVSATMYRPQGLEPNLCQSQMCAEQNSTVSINMACIVKHSHC